MDEIKSFFSYSPSTGSPPGSGSYCREKPRGQSDSRSPSHRGQLDRLLLVDRRRPAGRLCLITLLTFLKIYRTSSKLDNSWAFGWKNDHRALSFWKGITGFGTVASSPHVTPLITFDVVLTFTAAVKGWKKLFFLLYPASYFFFHLFISAEKYKKKQCQQQP